MTEKLYYKDSYIKEFDAEVISCEVSDTSAFRVELDRTAFFPEGGGQPSDIGYIADARVSDVQEMGERIIHYTDKPLETGKSVHCTLDFERRFRLMQNHSGEHIVSGVVHRLFGLDNVGFHMGHEDITVDYNGYLDRDAILRIERMSNEVVFSNVRIITEFPDRETLSNLEYRSKKEIDGDVRIVTVEGCDSCACCAPHVRRTGEIGIIKLLDAIKYKGGVRIHLLCGFDALDDYNKKYESVRHIANELSVKQADVSVGFDRFSADFAKSRTDVAVIRAELLSEKLRQIPFTEGNLCLFEKDLSGDALRRFADSAADKCTGICAVLSGDDGAYNYVIISRSADLRALQKEINTALSGRGGGSSEMLQGRAACTADEAIAYFKR